MRFRKECTLLAVACVLQISCGCTDSSPVPVPRVLEGLLSQRHASARSAFLSSPTVRCHVPARFSSSVPAARQPTLVKPRVAVLRASVGMSSSYSASHALSAEELAAGPPTIDISPLLEPGASVSKDEVVKKISKAAAKWGFFQVLGHGVPEDNIHAFDQAVERFFDQDKDYKYAIKRNAQNSRGYFDDELTKQTRDWKEAVDIGAQDGSLDARSSVDGFNQWPAGDALFRSDTEKYFKNMESLSRSLCQALALGLGEDAKYFDGLFDKHTSYLRINHYPPCPNPVASDFPLHSPNAETEGYLAINRHTDAGVLTVLRQKHSEPHSLQVFISNDIDKDHESRDGQWITVRPEPRAFTINIADMMQVYSNDRYVAPLHRVLANRDNVRYSAPFFLNPPYAADVEPLSTLGKPVYDKLNWGQYRRRRFEGDFADVGKEVQIADYRN